jgi:hypothetical protein
MARSIGPVLLAGFLSAMSIASSAEPGGLLADLAGSLAEVGDSPADAGATPVLANSFPADAGAASDAPLSAQSPCGAEEARIERRKAWLRARFEEQNTRGTPSPKSGIPNMIALYCEEHPKHEECTLGPPPIEFSIEELTWENQKTLEDRDTQVIKMKRQLADCRRRQR